MHFTCRSFIGKANDHFWSQFWEAEPDGSSKGHLFALITLSSSTKQDLAKQGRQILDQIRQHYFAPGTPIDPIATLKQITPDIIQSYQDQLSSLILIVVHQSKVHLFTYGSSSIAMSRNRIVSLLLSGQTNQSNTLSGPLQDQDRLFLFSDHFKQSYSWSNIKKDLINPDLNQVEDNIFSHLNESDDQNFQSASLINVHLDPSQTEIIVENQLPTTDPTPSLPKPIKRKIHIPSFNFKKRHRSPPLSVNPVVIKKNKKVNLFIAFLLLALLSVSIFLGFQKNQTQQTEATYQQLKEELIKKISDAKAVSNLNLDSAQSLGQEAQNTLQSMIELQVHSGEINSFQQQIKEILQKSGQSQALDLNFLYDTTFLTDDPDFSKMEISGDLLYLLDTKNSRIDSVNFDQKSTQNIAQNDDLQKAISITIAQNQVFFVTKDMLYQIKNKQLLTRYNLSESTVIDSTPVDLSSWGNSLYLLTQKNIFKFDLTNIDNPVAWLEDDQNLPSDPLSLSINGKVWLGSKTGQITPFLRGVEDSFIFKDQSSVTSVNSLFVTQDSDLLAFVDQSNFVYVYQKDGTVKGRYNLGDLTALDLVIHEPSSRLIILASDQKIYQIAL